MPSADRGAAYLDRNIIPADFDWREYDVEEERHKVRPASDFVDDVLASYRGDDEQLRGAYWPWDKANERGLRFRPGEVSIYAGINGHRKSMLTSQIALHLMRQKQPVLIASFEMAPRRTVDRMMRQSAGNKPPDAYGLLWKDWSQGRLWLYDHVGNCAPRQVLAVARYAVTTLGVKHVFVDSLMKVVAGTDDYTGQKTFVGGLCSLALAHDAHVHLVCHARKGKDVAAGIDKWDVKGAGEITDQADNVCLINKRDDAAEGEPNQWLEVAKQRNGEYEGTLGLFFHPEALSFAEAPGKKWPGIYLHDDERERERAAIQEEPF